jgi:putative cardiolipin synthase
MMVVDGALAVVGGRNIGVEYFMRAEDRNFVDIDLLAAGPVVSQLSAIFDRYWNSDFAYPVETIVKDALTPQARRDEFARLVANAQAPPPDTSVPPRYAMFTTTLNGLKLKHLGLIEADAKAIADPVAKAAGANDNTREGTVREMVVQEMLKAQEEIFVASPYFVPGTIGLETTRSLSARGIHMFLLTNSLASTDSPLAHVGYARARRKLVEDGVQIYELSPSLVKARGRLGQFRTSSGSLHEKVIVVDRRVVFIGSMNLDSRSERKNTELGLLIDSPALASQYLDNLDYEGSAYLVRQNAVNHALEWVEGQLGFEVTFSEEPEATFWQRLRTKLLEPFVPDEEL